MFSWCYHNKSHSYSILFICHRLSWLWLIWPYMIWFFTAGVSLQTVCVFRHFCLLQFLFFCLPAAVSLLLCWCSCKVLWCALCVCLLCICEEKTWTRVPGIASFTIIFCNSVRGRTIVSRKRREVSHPAAFYCIALSTLPSSHPFLSVPSSFTRYIIPFLHPPPPVYCLISFSFPAQDVCQAMYSRLSDLFPYCPNALTIYRIHLHTEKDPCWECSWTGFKERRRVWSHIKHVTSFQGVSCKHVRLWSCHMKRGMLRRLNQMMNKTFIIMKYNNRGF